MDQVSFSQKQEIHEHVRRSETAENHGEKGLSAKIGDVKNAVDDSENDKCNDKHDDE